MEKKYIKPIYLSKLIKNYAEEMALDPGATLKAFLDYQEKPCIVSQSTDGNLYIILQRDGISTGWTQINLTESFGTNKKITTFDLSKDFNKVSIALGLAWESGKNELYVANYLDTKETNWEDCIRQSDFWKAVSLEDDSAQINKILIYRENILFSTKKEGDEAKYYLVEEGKFRTYDLPENGCEILDLKLGQWNKKKGVFLLYQVGKDQTLLFTSYPDQKYKKTTKHRFDCDGKKINSIALVEDITSGNHHLYAAGETLFIFNSNFINEQIKGQCLAPNLKNVNLDYLQIVQYDSAFSCWFLDKTSNFLFYMHNDLEYNNWSIPIALKKNVKNFACIRGNDIQNHLFYVDIITTRLNHYWEDKVSTLWSETFVPVQGTGNIKEFFCYFTQVKFPNIDQILLDKDYYITVKSPNNFYVTINEKTFQVGPDYSFQINLNEEDLFLLTPISNFTDAVLYLTSDILEKPFFVDMAEFVYQRISSLVTNNCLELKNLKDVDGLPVIPDKYEEKGNLLAMISEMLKFFIDFRNQCKTNEPNFSKQTNSSVILPALSQDFLPEQDFSPNTDSLVITFAIASLVGGLTGGFVGALTGGFVGGAKGGPPGLFVGAFIGAVVGTFVAVGATYMIKVKRITGKPVEPVEKNFPCIVIQRNKCQSKMTIYDQSGNGLKVDLDLSHIISCLNMILTFIGISIPFLTTPKKVPKEEINDCIYRALLH